MSVGGWWAVLKATANSYVEDKVPRLAASLAFYTVLSVAPLLVVVLAVAGLFFGREAVAGRVAQQFTGLVGDEGGQALQAMIAAAHGPGSGFAMAAGTFMVLIGASGVFAELQDSLNTIWEVAPKPGRGVLGVVRDRFLSLTMVFGVCFLLLVSMVLSAFLAALTRVAGLERAGVIGEVLNFAISFATVAVLFAMLFKLLPDARIAWRDVWAGAAATSLLFVLGKLLIGLYLGRAGLGSAYGAAGSFVVFVVWVYYSGQILFLGAELTKAYANRFGGRVLPAKNAEPVTAEARAQQGLAVKK